MLEKLKLTGAQEEYARSCPEMMEMLAGIPALAARYAEAGISEEIMWDSLSDVGRWMRDYEARHGGEVKFVKYGWLRRTFNFELFKLGRLQFMRGKYGLPAVVYMCGGVERALAPDGARFTPDGDADGVNGVVSEAAWVASLRETADEAVGFEISREGIASRPAVTLKKEAGRLLGPGDDILEIHIPAEDPLTPAAVSASLDMARDFFPRYFGYSPAAFTCGSWLLDPTIGKLLPKGNIAAFQREFHLVPSASDDHQTIERAFGGPVDDWRSAPEDTALRKALKAYYLSGRRARSMSGYILFKK